MIPTLKNAMDSLAVRIATHVMPALPDGYTAADAGLIASLLMALGQEAERGVAARLDDIEALRELFTAALETLPDATLATRLRVLLDGSPEDLRLSVLDAEHGTWLEALSDLHAAVDDPQAPAAAAQLNERIWRFLEVHCERHAYALPL